MNRLKELQARLEAIQGQAAAVMQAAEKENRDLTADELKQVEECAEQAKAVQAQIAAAKSVEGITAAVKDGETSAGRKSKPDQPGAGMDVDPDAKPAGGEDRKQQDPTLGFASLRDFVMAAAEGSKRHAERDPRLVADLPTGIDAAAPSTYGSEGVGADLGFLIPPQYSTRMAELALSQDALLPMTDGDPIEGNSIAYPADETTPWGSTGIQAYWENEADQYQQSKPAVGLRTLRLRKLTAIAPLTEELLQDGSGLAGYIQRKGSEAIRWKTNDALINGHGVGQPLGIKNAGSLVTVAKESAQGADSIVVENLAKMYSRALNPRRCVWMANPDTFPTLFNLKDNAGTRVWQAVGPGLEGFDGMLINRPVMFTDHCQTVGDKGDIYFADLMGLKSITKAAGIEFATSMHLWFDYDVMAFKLRFRVDAQPWLSAPVTPPNGSNTRSHFVTLAERA